MQAYSQTFKGISMSEKVSDKLTKDPESASQPYELKHLYQLRRFEKEPERFRYNSKRTEAFEQQDLMGLFLLLQPSGPVRASFCTYVRRHPITDNFSWICQALTEAPADLQPVLKQLDELLVRPDSLFAEVSPSFQRVTSFLNRPP